MADLQRVLLIFVALKCTCFALASKSCHLTAANLSNGVGRLVCKLDAPLRDTMERVFPSGYCSAYALSLP